MESAYTAELGINDGKTEGMDEEMKTIKEISEHIIRKYLDSCLATNIKSHRYTDEELIDECENFFYHEKLNWCGCGDPNLAKKCIRDYLDIIKTYHDIRDFDDAYLIKTELMKRRFGCETVYDNELLLCLAYAMDAAGFTEHGSSIGGAWLTDEGQMFLTVLKLNKNIV